MTASSHGEGPPAETTKKRGQPAKRTGSLHLIVFSRAPEAGATKTRLTPPLSPESARDLHVACLNDVLSVAGKWARLRIGQQAGQQTGSPAAPVKRHLFITPAGSQPVFRAAGVKWPQDFALHNQRGEDLGQRMAEAMTRVMASGDAVLLIGCDLPLLMPEHLEAAAEALVGTGVLPAADAVFAPTPDGGYWLVGTRRDPAPLFNLEGWGGDSVLARSLAAAEGAGYTVALGPELPDVDTVADLRSVLRHPLALKGSTERREALPLLQRLMDEGMLG